MHSSGLRERIFALLYKDEKPEMAILQLNRLLKSTPENSQALALKAYALNRLANVREEWKYSRSALELAERALLLNPDDDLALISKGWALIDLGGAREALPILQRATRANPQNEYAWYNLAWAKYLTGDAASSMESMKHALEIAPENEIIKHGKERMQCGEVPKHLKKSAT